MNFGLSLVHFARFINKIRNFRFPDGKLKLTQTAVTHSKLKYVLMMCVLDLWPKEKAFQLLMGWMAHGNSISHKKQGILGWKYDQELVRKNY